MTDKTFRIPEDGNLISIDNGMLNVPDSPIIPFIEGDGIGPDIWRAAQRVFDMAIAQAYSGRRRIHWMEVFAGEKAFNRSGSWLPDETIEAFRKYLVGIKGPLTTPVGGGIRSLNVALRKELDLYVCQRPVRWFEGVPSPVLQPEKVDMVVFRENTEDIYTGIEFEEGTEDNRRFMELLRENFPKEYAKIRFPKSAGIGLKPVSIEGTHRLVRAAIRWAIDNKRRSVTLVHKGNIMKFTEGGFRKWGYELAESEFGDLIYTRLRWDQTKTAQGEAAANQEQEAAIESGKLIVKDAIADIVFEQIITRADEFDVLATTNLNGDYLSDALAAQVGGVGIAPGGNINYVSGLAVFEATHGTAPPFANKNVANPSSIVLSGEMLLRYIGWKEAADLIIKGIETAIREKKVTFDLHRLMHGAHLLKTSEFAGAVIEGMQKEG
jgi:isocitrate dehydrogenase